MKSCRGDLKKYGEDRMEKIIIGVCTAKRPQMLLACLRSLANNTAPTETDVEICVCDNEAKPNNRNIVAEFSRNCPFIVHYIHEPRRGIPQARNAIVAKALELNAAWLAFIDDDETATAYWVVNLRLAARMYGADTVGGPVVRRYPEKMPFWGVKRRPPPHATFMDGEVVNMLPTYNVLASMRLFRPAPVGMGLRFDERLAFSGGEDTQLGMQAIAQGAHMIWTTKAIVHETMCPSRLTYTHNLRLAYHHGVQQFILLPMNPGQRHVNKSRLAVRAFREAINAVIWLPALPILAAASPATFKRKTLEAGWFLAFAVGTLAGLAGANSHYYKKIDGY
jgi:succinoglycan biosynthesis protein ExoM